MGGKKENVKACVSDGERENLYQHVVLVVAYANTGFTNLYCE